MQDGSGRVFYAKAPIQTLPMPMLEVPHLLDGIKRYLSKKSCSVCCYCLCYVLKEHESINN